MGKLSKRRRARERAAQRESWDAAKARARVLGCGSDWKRTARTREHSAVPTTAGPMVVYERGTANVAQMTRREWEVLTMWESDEFAPRWVNVDGEGRTIFTWLVSDIRAGYGWPIEEVPANFYDSTRVRDPKSVTKYVQTRRIAHPDARKPRLKVDYEDAQAHGIVE